MTTKGSQLRHLRGLLNDVEAIELDIYGNHDNGPNIKDAFVKSKLDLNQTLNTIKRDISSYRNIEKNIGSRNSEAIRLKYEINQNLLKAKALQNKMEHEYNKQQNKMDDDEEKYDDIKERKELVYLMKMDLEYIQHEFSKNDDKNTGFNKAKQARKNRQIKRERGLISSDPVQLTRKQQLFIQESIKRDAILDKKLTEIHKGVKIIREIANDTNEALDTNMVMINDMSRDMTRITEKLESRNEKMKKIFASKEKGTKWCCILVLVIIFLACIGYIYNAYIA